MTYILGSSYSRNILTIKNEEKLGFDDLILYRPYKNIVQKLCILMSDIEAKQFDPIAKAFDGISATPESLKNYYEALLGITSYYQSSQGGRGTYIEKKIASLSDSSVLSFRTSEIHYFFENIEIYRKWKFLGKSSLTTREKKQLRISEWDVISKKDFKTDLVNFNENKLILLEIKNRVDSGGTAARREIWNSKFYELIEFLASKEEYLRKNNKTISLSTFLKEKGVDFISLNLGILFNESGSLGTKQGDKERGFYSSNETEFRLLNSKLKQLEDQQKLGIINYTHEDSLQIMIKIDDIIVQIKPIYGNEIIKTLLSIDDSLETLLKVDYDDIWLALLIAIREREILLKTGLNHYQIFDQLLKVDRNLRLKFNQLIEKNGSENELKDIVNYIIETYNGEFEEISNSYIDLFEKMNVNNFENIIGDIILLKAMEES